MQWQSLLHISKVWFLLRQNLYLVYTAYSYDNLRVPWIYTHFYYHCQFQTWWWAVRDLVKSWVRIKSEVRPKVWLEVGSEVGLLVQSWYLRSEVRDCKCVAVGQMSDQKIGSEIIDQRPKVEVRVQQSKVRGQKQRSEVRSQRSKAKDKSERSAVGSQRLEAEIRSQKSFQR